MNSKTIFICFGVLLLLLSMVGVCIFMGVIITSINDPLTSFQAPKYVPGDYVSANNNSTSIDKAFYFKDNEMDQFMVAAIKDTNQSQLTELQKPLAEDGNMATINIKIWMIKI